MKNPPFDSLVWGSLRLAQNRDLMTEKKPALPLITTIFN